MHHSLRVLLTGLIDYAGLFPPAALGMLPAVRNYAAYCGGERAWALGRFIVPASRLDEFERAAISYLPQGREATPWRLSLLGGADLEADASAILEFNSRHTAGAASGAAVIDTIEIKAERADDIERAVRRLPKTLTPYIEIPIANDPDVLVRAVAEAGARAKVRTGGLSREAFPSAPDLARFISLCAAANVPFKATAGLHHPVRCIRPFTYDEDSPSGVMHGFLNVFLAAAFIRGGMNTAQAAQLLEEERAEAFRFDEDGVTWRAHRLTNGQLMSARQEFATAFGSCSFEEPIEDLKTIHLL